MEESFHTNLLTIALASQLSMSTFEGNFPYIVGWLTWLFLFLLMGFSEEFEVSWGKELQTEHEHVAPGRMSFSFEAMVQAS